MDVRVIKANRILPIGTKISNVKIKKGHYIGNVPLEDGCYEAKLPIEYCQAITEMRHA